MTVPAALFLESLRLDLEPLVAVRRKALSAIELGVGGFILFGGRAEEAGRLIEELQSAAGRHLWLAADLERGPGQQFTSLPHVPPPAGLASHPDPVAATSAAARITARGARSLGINWVLAPVLDLAVEPKNPIVGTRSFGSDPEVVARLGAAWIDACQAEGVAACAKHFPGHGRTVADSHEELPVVEADKEALMADLAPFRAVIGTVAGVMTAHVSYPALGCDGPATRDVGILGDLLRDELAFEGLIVTDAMNMAGFADAGSPGEPTSPAVGALAAGCDLLLYPPDLPNAIEAVNRAVDRSPAFALRVEEALARSEAVASRFDSPPGDSGARAAADAAGPGDTEALDLAAACIVTRGESGSRPRRTAPLRVETVWDDREQPGRPVFGAGFRAELESRGWTLATGDAPAAATVVLLASTPQAWKGTAGLTDEGVAAWRSVVARSGDIPLFPIVFGHAWLLEELGVAGAGAWGTEPTIERAAAEWLDRLDGIDRDDRGRDGDA